MRWREQPPATPVIAAGSTGSQPATRELLSVIAGLPQGKIVLPGLDRDMDDRSWMELDETHPQFGLRELLKALGRERRDVADWPGGAGSARHLLITELMRPAETTEEWVRPLASSLEHVTRADCATPHQEALVIALALRRILQEERKTAALVTPDRGLARRVTAELGRWNIDIDDSAGTPLSDTPSAGLLQALVGVVDERFAPVALLALLKHPLCTLGGDRAAVLDAARRLDRKCLRGLKPMPGLAAIRARIDKARFGDLTDRLAVHELIDRVEAATAALAALMQAGAAPDVLLDATIAAAETVASTDALWSGDAGEALADALARLRAAWTGKDAIAGGEWPALLATMLEPEIVRPSFGRHPRLAIWGPLEARLQRADLLVLGGLNEGTWPPAVETGPWLNRPMRATLGLPQPERRIGLSAHDFVAALGAERVLLTRAEREGGAPTVPSRWLARLDALFGYEPGGKSAPPEYIQRGQHEYLAWADALDRPGGYRPWRRPEPRPPLEARPTRLSVSSIEQWRRDPYGLYARRILGLEALDPLEAELGAADRGSALHDALDEFLATHPSGLLPPGALAEFEALGEKHLGTLMTAPAERAFWWPRFQRLARWFIATENQRRRNGTRLLASETTGRLTVGPSSRPLTIEARADRIDEIEPGVWDVIDYKTGRVPTNQELEALFAPQLLLEAAMAERGGFDKIAGKRDGGASLLLAGQRPRRRRQGERDQGERRAGAGHAGPGREDGGALRQAGHALPRPALVGLHPGLQRLRASRARRRMVDGRRGRRMSVFDPALDPLALATDSQRRATTPGHSAWVEANAGTGKTKVLTDRVTRLLLDRVKPERILCLTFTKAAAAEMRNRLAGQLGRWAMMTDAKLDEAIEQADRPRARSGRARRRPPPVRARARRAGRHQHPDHPRLLPGAAQALPAGGGRRAGLRGAGRGRRADAAAPRPGRADGGAGTA